MLYDHKDVRASVSLFLQETEFVTAEQITDPSNAGFCLQSHDSQEGNPIINAPGQISSAVRQGERGKRNLCWLQAEWIWGSDAGEAAAVPTTQFNIKMSYNEVLWYPGQASSLVTLLTSCLNRQATGLGDLSPCR